MKDQLAKLHQTIFNSLNLNGYKARITSVSIISKLEKEIIHSKKFLSEIFIHERLNIFHFNRNDELKYARSIIITAAPQYPITTVFCYDGRKINTYVPPTYTYNTDTNIRKILQDILPKDIWLSDVILPLKLLSVFSGLSKYGRNNIAYINGMGSFFRLKAFLSNLECIKPNEYKISMLEDCDNCIACLYLCPTNAISKKRFFIEAEKCLTFLNERKDDFPDWVNPSWHNSLIGCMRCQLYCPANKKFRHLRDGIIEFDENETKLILNFTPFNSLSNSTKQKITHLNLQDDYDLLPRNLSVLLNNKKGYV
ncbi:MAG: 4Fe-4S double cluster binding domain-containing protein [Melioribacteraceae bacterium]|nr:4Fe-4S double cluster binding domain-containing protein [Melioribacteraceae bacterium]